MVSFASKTDQLKATGEDVVRTSGSLQRKDAHGFMKSRFRRRLDESRRGTAARGHRARAAAKQGSQLFVPISYAAARAAHARKKWCRELAGRCTGRRTGGLVE